MPYVVNKLDKLLWYVYCTIFNFVCNLPPVKKLISKTTNYLIGFVARRAILMMTQINKDKISNKDKRNVTNTLDKIANGKEVDEEKLREMMNMLMKKLKTT